MKAAIRRRYGSIDAIEEVEQPSPGDNQVLIKVCASTVNRTDCVILTGKPYIMSLFTGFLKPHLLICAFPHLLIIFNLQFSSSKMQTQSLSLHVSPEIGDVSAELMVPDNPICIMTLAHGAGAGMNHEFMVKISRSLAEKAIATLRFNFPFTEKQKRRPDTPAVAHKTIEAAIAMAHKLFPLLPVFAAGKSFGGRMSSQYLAAQAAADVKGLIFYGFPLHPPGKPSADRAEHLKSVTVPMLFLQGTRDELASSALIEKVCAELPSATLTTIEGANHAFKAGKQDIMPVLTGGTRSWIDEKIKS